MDSPVCLPLNWTYHVPECFLKILVQICDAVKPSKQSRNQGLSRETAEYTRQTARKRKVLAERESPTSLKEEEEEGTTWIVTFTWKDIKLFGPDRTE